MKNLLLLSTIALFALGCGHVSHDDLERELSRSQEELRSEIADGDVASLECSLNLGVYQQAGMFCSHLNAYCNVVEAYENHCLREGDGVTMLPPVRGVSEAIDEAFEAFNTAARQRQQEGNTETPSQSSE